MNGHGHALNPPTFHFIFLKCKYWERSRRDLFSSDELNFGRKKKKTNLTKLFITKWGVTSQIMFCINIDKDHQRKS